MTLRLKIQFGVIVRTTLHITGKAFHLLKVYRNLKVLRMSYNNSVGRFNGL